MKKLILVAQILASVILSAQQERKLLPNKITTQHKINNGRNLFVASPSYSEVFIRVLDMGRFRIQIDDQNIENATGMFRFFDLEEGRHTLSIYEGKYLLYRTPIITHNNRRLVLDYLYSDGLFLVDETLISTTNTLPVYHSIDDVEFAQFFTQFKKLNFDNDKIKLFNTQIDSLFTSKQILELIKTMSFDENKLLLVKTAFRQCSDPKNYYLVAEGMSFSPNKEKLYDFIKEQTQ